MDIEVIDRKEPLFKNLYQSGVKYWYKTISQNEIEEKVQALSPYLTEYTTALREINISSEIILLYVVETGKLLCISKSYESVIFAIVEEKYFSFDKYPFDSYFAYINYNYQCIKQKKDNPSDSVKNDILDDKLPWQLFPLATLEPVVEVYKAGAKKYGPNRWQNLENGFERYYAAALRHLVEYVKGHRYDAETGCQHLAQFIWNGIAMLDYDKRNLGLYPWIQPENTASDRTQKTNTNKKNYGEKQS